MLRMDNTNNDFRSYGKADEEFETMESVIKKALEIVQEYEKLTESSKKINRGKSF